MAIDSTAELLFNISANTDDATENITRFRALMGQDLDSMAAQFTDWSDEVLGDLSTVSGAMIAMTAGVAAGILAVGAAVKESTTEYHAYAESIYKASVVTGMHAEDLSALHSLAAKTGVSFETLTQGLVKFEANIVEASRGSKTQMEAFKALGISQAEVIAGQKNVLPLLVKVMDGFHDDASAVQQSALARQLFGKGGAVLVDMLRRGSEAMREAIRECAEYGLKLGDEDVAAAHRFTVSQTVMKEQLEGIGTTIGKTVMPYLSKLVALLMAGAGATKHFFEGFVDPLHAKGFDILTQYHLMIEKINGDMAKSATEGMVNLITPEMTQTVKEAKQDFAGLLNIVESMKSKIASQGTGWDRLTEEVAHYHVEIDKATAELAKLQKEGKITPESLKASQDALNQIPTLLAKVITDTTAKLNAEDTQRWGEAVQKSFEAEDKITEELRQAGERRVEVTREIADRQAAAGEQGYAQQRAQLQKQMADWAESLSKKTALTAEDWDAIDRITMEGLAKIDRTETTGWQDQIRKLQEHLDQATAANGTAQQKLALQYQKDLEQYNQVEEQKALKTAQTEAQVIQIMQMYGQIRTQITVKYQDDLQKLLDSQGFQGVFGNYFGNLIKGNQNLMRQWAQSSNQSILMVRVALESLKEMADKTFQSFVQGMGQSIAQAIVMKTSIVKAMEQLLKSTLESFAGQAITAALMATGWGFYDLAIGDYPAATSAFTAAAVFGSVGAAAAVAGRLIPSASGAGSGSGSGAGSGARSGAGAGGVVSGGNGGGGGGQGQPNVYVNVTGPVIGPSGAAQLCDIINQAVYGNNAQLYASHNPQGVPL